MGEEEHDAMFIHSKCCMAHWELTYHDGKYELKCEKCGKPAPTIIVNGPPLEEECAICKEKKKKGLLS
jgi:hypothetical protein